MIVVVVADEHDVRNRQGIERQRRRAHAARAEAAERPRMGCEHRVGEDHRVRRAQQKRRVADERGGDGSRVDVRRRRIRCERHGLRPGRFLPRALPFDHVADGAGPLAGRIEEALAVAVIGNRQRAPRPPEGGRYERYERQGCCPGGLDRAHSGHRSFTRLPLWRTMGPPQEPPRRAGADTARAARS